jgi:rod shape-determining protein MreC
MKKTKKNRIFIIIIMTLFILSMAVYSSVPGSPLNFISTPFSFITDPGVQFIAGVFKNVEGYFSLITETDEIRKANIELENEVAHLRSRINELEEKGRRWEELKHALSIKETFADYQIVGARVLTREIGDWFDLFRINVGKRDKIAIDDQTSYAVVDPNMNLVGRIYSTDYISSKVMPIINEGSIVSGKVNVPGGAMVRIRGELLLKDQNLCRVDNFSDDALIQVGDEIVTSGLGGLYPPGIPVGVIVDIINEGQKVEHSAVLRVYTNYKTLNDVFIFKGSFTE